MEQIKTKDDFKKFVEDFKKENTLPYAYALGIAYKDEKDQAIATRWLSTNVQQNEGFLSVILHALGTIIEETTFWYLSDKSQDILKDYFMPFEGEDGHANIDVLKTGQSKSLYIIIYPTRESLTEKGPINNADALCRLTMISRLHFKPNELNLDGMFGLLNNLYYTEYGALTENQWEKEFLKGKIVQPISCDKIPPLWWGAPVPTGVRIADPSRVRLGAYLSPGTTIMHEGFVNFNAGTLGACMVEGRISAGVIVGKDSDLGGGSSTMGVLSGGGKEKITIGENCLIGANGGTGISLGDRCTIEAGLYITVGMIIGLGVNSEIKDKFKLKGAYYSSQSFGYYIKAINLSGKNNMLLRRNSVDGGVELLWNENPNKLNAKLHA
ncbi:MAG: DapH/DapD/GlmU-related protein [Candidatus Nomurabacteria bacterium]|nr:DapH/DapD/GlmU-related protein [Candidatus Nomurabacteria bacterium]